MRRGETGTALVSSLAGVVVVLVLLLFSVQTLTALSARSSVDAAGHHAARQVASGSVDHGDPAAVASAQARAEAGLRAMLGGIGEDASVRWQVSGDTVRLRVVIEAPTLLPRALGGGMLRRVDRTYVFRVEELR